MSPALNKTDTVGEHTRLPWVAYPYLSPKGKAFIKSLDGPAVCTGNTLTEDDALFIVKACNSHQGLVAELQQARHYVQAIADRTTEGRVHEDLARIGAAIAKATGGA